MRYVAPPDGIPDMPHAHAPRHARYALHGNLFGTVVKPCKASGKRRTAERRKAGAPAEQWCLAYRPLVTRKASANAAAIGRCG